MQPGLPASLHFDLQFLAALLSIVVIDLVLAGDNAVVIAMAVRSLPQEQRKRGLLFGAAAAVLLRVFATVFVAQLLNIGFVKLAGGVLILWIAVKLFVEGAPEEGRERRATTIWQAIKIIVIADITMSLDNMLAVGGASHGNLFLLLFGLGLSIPFIVLTSNLLSMLMDRYPVIITFGAAILGKVAGEMLITDPFTAKLLPSSLLTPDLQHPVRVLQYSTEALFAAGVIIAGKLWMRRGERKEAKMAAVTAGPGARAVEQAQPVLTISREFGSGGREIGQAVARDLGWTYVDREILLDDIGKDGSKWERWAQDLDEHRPTVWERYDWSFRGFAALLQLHMLEHAAQGGVVIMGRGGTFVLQGIPHVLRVRVSAPLDQRIERVVRREGVDRGTARWLCEKIDSERACFLHAVYGKPWDDPAQYDLVLAVPGQSVDAEVARVKEALAGLAASDEAREALRMRTSAARVKSGIMTNPSFLLPVFDVVPSGEGLVLRGVTHTPKEHRRIEEEACRLAGGIPIRCELHYRK